MAMLASATAGAVEYVPVFNATLMGGQYFFQAQKANLNGNASVVFAPMMKTSERWSFIPMMASSFQGTKGTESGVGAGTLFQQQMDHRISFGAVHNPEGSTWKFKPGLSYKREFMKETRDETWGKGLFDYEKIGVGFEAENIYKEPFSYRLGLDLFRIHFPNYQSLESKSGVDPNGNPLGRELAGKNVLDTYNTQLSASITMPYPYDEPKVSLSAGYSFLFQNYIDERLVDKRGALANAGRKDFQQSLNGSIGYPRPVKLFGKDVRLDSTVGVNVAMNSSNQNSFDAARAHYVEDSYSYYSYGIGPSFTFAWGDPKRPAWTGLSFRYNKTQYFGRLAQDNAGLYTFERQFQSRYVLGLSYGYPIAPGFSLKVQTNMLWIRSNNTFERNYSYNYRTTNYLMGFTYEY